VNCPICPDKGIVICRNHCMNCGWQEPHSRDTSTTLTCEEVQTLVGGLTDIAESSAATCLLEFDDGSITVGDRVAQLLALLRTRIIGGIE